MILCTRYRYSNYITRYRYCRLQYCPIPGTYLNIQYPVHCIPGTGTRTGEVATVNFLLVPNTFYLVLFGFPCTSKKISSDLHQPHLASLQHHGVCCLVCRGFVSSCVLLVVCCVLLMHQVFVWLLFLIVFDDGCVWLLCQYVVVVLHVILVVHHYFIVTVFFLSLSILSIFIQLPFSQIFKIFLINYFLNLLNDYINIFCNDLHYFLVHVDDVMLTFLFVSKKSFDDVIILLLCFSMTVKNR